MDRPVLLLFENEVGDIWFDEVDIYSVEVFGSDFKILLCLEQTLREVLGILKISLLEVGLVKEMGFLFGFEIFFLFYVVFKGAVVKQY